MYTESNLKNEIESKIEKYSEKEIENKNPNMCMEAQRALDRESNLE